MSCVVTSAACEPFSSITLIRTISSVRLAEAVSELIDCGLRPRSAFYYALIVTLRLSRALLHFLNADVAQLVEHALGMGAAQGSSPCISLCSPSIDGDATAL